MNYKRIYSNLVERAKDRILEGYQEKHHIIPKCLGGTDDKTNLVGLTPEEHFLAHQLLVKIHPDNSDLIYACWYMQFHNSEFRINNKIYGWLKRKHSARVSEHFKLYWKDEKNRLSHIEKMTKFAQSKMGKFIRSMAGRKSWENSTKERKQQIRKIQKENNARVAERNRELWKDPQYRIKMKNARSGILWWTDGIIDVKSKVSPGDAFVRGRSCKNIGRPSKVHNGKK